jgi:hypothetical protein
MHGTSRKIIVILCAATAIIFVASRLIGSSRLIPEGWDDLAFCLNLVSIDGKKHLTLSDDGTATVEETSGSKLEKMTGTWELSDKGGRYVIKFGNEGISYERIAPPGADICILAAGSAYTSNLKQSWFAVRQDDDPPDR